MSAILSVAVLWSSPVSAQTNAAAVSLVANAGADIEDIVVTARRKAEALQSVPIAISALSGRDLETRGVQKISDIANSVPGVMTSPASIRGSNTPVFMIRGMVNRDPTLTNDPSIGIYFAEVPWARPDGTNAALIDLESVEVLKGPQGTLFGRNSTAGAILITPKAPTAALEGYAKLGTGNYGLFSAEAVGNIPLGETLAVRIAVSHEERKGFARNVTAGIRTNDVDNYTARLSAKWAPTENFTSTLIGSYFQSRVNGDGGKLIKIAPRAPSAGVAGLYARLPDALLRSNALGRYEYLSSLSPSVAATPINGVPSVLVDNPYGRVKTATIQNATTIELGTSSLLGEIRLKNIASYRHVTNRYSSEAITVDFLNVNNASYLNVNQFSEELQLQGKSGALDYILGTFYFREDGKDQNRAYSIVPVTSITDNRIANTSYSAFFNFNYDLSGLIAPGLGLTGGIRLNHDRRFLDNQNRRQTTPGQVAAPAYTCVLQPTVPVNDGSLCSFKQTVSFTEPTWNIGLNYKPKEGSLLYATISHGYRTGGFNAFATALAPAAPFDPEKVYNYEIGSKNDFTLSDVRVRWNVAAYYIKYSGIQRQLNVLTSANTLSLLTVNAAKAHIWGAESELVVRPTRDLEFSLGYAYTRPKYDSFKDSFREPTNGVIYPIDISDSKFTVVSRHTLNASLRYALPLADDMGKLTLSGTYYYRSSFYNGSDINTAQCTIPGNPNSSSFYTNCYNRTSKLPGYGLLNLRAEWRDTMGLGIDTALFVNNVTNKFYYSNAISTLSSLGGLVGTFGPPRMFGGSVTIPFGAARE